MANHAFFVSLHHYQKLIQFTIHNSQFKIQNYNKCHILKTI